TVRSWRKQWPAKRSAKRGMGRGCCAPRAVPGPIARRLGCSIGSGTVCEDTFAVHRLVSAQEARPAGARAFQCPFEVMEVVGRSPGKAVGALWLPTHAAARGQRRLLVHSAANCARPGSLAEITL